MSESSKEPLDEDEVEKLLESGGLLSQKIPGFESREEQKKMLLDVLKAYNNNQIALIEAGTGTGKSLAYLLPAILFALTTRERTLISTNTITLQEQLIDKDIPMLTKALNLPVKAVLVKGMGNYLCIRKLKESLKELTTFTRQEQGELESIAAWEYHTTDGSRSDLSFTPKSTTWEKVSAESDSCTRERCPHYKECYFFAARKQANDAHLLVSNHSLLFSDLSYRMANDVSLLPEYERLIIDEAHHIEDTATEHLATHVSTLLILKTLGRLMAEHSRTESAAGKLPQLKRYIYEHFTSPPLPPEVNKLLLKLENELPAMKEELNKQLHDTFDLYMEFLSSQNKSLSNEADKNKLRLLEKHLSLSDWQERVVPATEALIEKIKVFAEAISGVEAGIKFLDNERFDEKTQGIRADILALQGRLQAAAESLKAFIAKKLPEERVHWIETYQTRGHENVSLVAATLDIATLLADHLFSVFKTVVLCSATLTTNKNFAFIRERLGIKEELIGKRAVLESRYSSPFNFQKQSLLTIPTDLPPPNAPTFNAAATTKIWNAITASNGNAFVLFTSYGMLRECYSALEERLKAARYPAMKQGDSARHQLIQWFKETDRSVLFGTDSFWEGVDISGEALRCVIIVKLPFKVPTEPIIQARTEALTKAGKSAFMEYALPQAVMKFKQGFGRLIRNSYDRGCIVCLDTRLITKGYGSYFLNSLPPCTKVIGKGEDVEKQMKDFYKTSYRLVVEKQEALERV